MEAGITGYLQKYSVTSRKRIVHGRFRVGRTGRHLERESPPPPKAVLGSSHGSAVPFSSPESGFSLRNGKYRRSEPYSTLGRARARGHFLKL